MRTFKLAMVSALALVLTVPAFAQTAPTTSSTSTPGVTAKIETKSNGNAVVDSKSATKKVDAIKTKTSKTSSLHKVSHKKHEHKKVTEHSTSKM